MKYSLNLATGTFVNHRRLFAIFSALGLFLFGLLVVNTMSMIRDSSRTRQLELRLEELRGEKKGAGQQGEISTSALAKMAQRIEVANELLVRDNYRWTALLDQLETHLADGISIRGLQPDYKSGVLRLSGVAASITDLRNFIDNLSRSDVFTQVYLKDQRTEKTKDDLDGGILFSIELKKRGGDES
jgi:type IV pilus assembly protein PilN